MGREVRKVPADWQHPKNERDQYIPLYGRSYAKEAAEYDEEAAQWEKGLRAKTVFHDGGGWHNEWVPKDADCEGMSFIEWHGKRPEEADYMPDWPDDQRTHLQMYEDTSEGTPISPVMETSEELARWLADNKASAFGGMTATYDQWLSTIKRGFACSAVITDGRFESGVAALSAARGEEQKS